MNRHLLLALSVTFSLTITACSGPEGQQGTSGIDSSKTTIPTSTSSEHPAFKQFFDDYHVEGCAVVYDATNDHYHRYNAERCATRFAPASTFKIYNSLVGLETGVIEDADYVIPWDNVQRSIPSWNQDHNLRSAITNSVVWYYQELARRVGRERMEEWLAKEPYGNSTIGKNVDEFWLDGSIKITADEQIEFLKRLHNQKLAFSDRSMEIVEDIMINPSPKEYTLRAKTGWTIRLDTNIGWWVGYVEKGDSLYYFATNIQTNDPQENFPAGRKNITYRILQELGILKEEQQ